MTDDATLSRSALKDQVFLRMASELSRLGTCCRLKVGAVLLRPKRQGAKKLRASKRKVR